MHRLIVLLGVLALCGLFVGTIAVANCEEGLSGLNVSPDPFKFGAKNEKEEFTVQNTGKEEIQDLKVRLVAEVNFKITKTTCGKKLAGGAECKVTVECLEVGKNDFLIAESEEQIAKGSAQISS